MAMGCFMFEGINSCCCCPSVHHDQARLEAMEIVVAKAQEPDAAGYASVLAQCMAHVPGFDDKNFQVCSRGQHALQVATCCPWLCLRVACLDKALAAA